MELKAQRPTDAEAAEDTGFVFRAATQQLPVPGHRGRQERLYAS